VANSAQDSANFRHAQYVETHPKASTAFCMGGMRDTLMTSNYGEKMNIMEEADKSRNDTWITKGTIHGVEDNVKAGGQDTEVGLASPTSGGKIRKWKKQARRVERNETPGNFAGSIGGKRRSIDDAEERENCQKSKKGKEESINGAPNNFFKVAAAKQPRPQQ
jgi:hypothetical protein